VGCGVFPEESVMSIAVGQHIPPPPPPQTQWPPQDKVCPSGTVPCIVDNGAALWESSVVMEYVDDK
jgi:glutathione S-transferase